MNAIIIADRVAELVDGLPTLGANEGAQVMECGAEVRVGWLLEGGALVAPSTPPAPGPNVDLDAAIVSLEVTMTQRRLREAVLTEAGKAWLVDLDAQIAALRVLRIQDGTSGA